MKPDDVMHKFGKCTKSDESQGATELLQYEIRDADNDPDLKAYGYPVYYAEYEFEDDKLVRFRFGFEYP
jgi:hypothetical protein